MLIFQGKHVDFFVGNILFTRRKIIKKYVQYIGIRYYITFYISRGERFDKKIM